MTKQTTSEQLRALMQSHVETVAVPSQPVQTPTVPTVSTPPHVQTRFSVRLLPTEIAKINSIIKNTVLITGERTTLTDVLRVGLGRMGDSTQISEAELTNLRASDRRRHQSRHVPK